ncbi:hypothetical protein AVEN_161964-1 [Araneus ventricosus]|uniref:Uncharacterized protein n=1 Tax=Araneus ventricosus TaxID=182803 RepID=A0A4Y2QPC4_ARAVE|nr:hypothetical protein AVEN_161964-1 [Araneus ventricosus]
MLFLACDNIASVDRKRGEDDLKIKPVSYSGLPRGGQEGQNSQDPGSSPRESEGILLIKPKNETMRAYVVNRKLFTDILEDKNPAIRPRSMGKLYEGGVKLVAASVDDMKVIMDIFKTPPGRAPHMCVSP